MVVILFTLEKKEIWSIGRTYGCVLGAVQQSLLRNPHTHPMTTVTTLDPIISGMYPRKDKKKEHAKNDCTFSSLTERHYPRKDKKKEHAKHDCTFSSLTEDENSREETGTLRKG